MALKNAMTADFLRSAYGGESMAHMRYLIWGDAAEKDGYPNIARLFKAVAYAEWAHAKNHADLFQKAQDKAKEGKDIEADTIYICPVCGFTEIGDNVEKCPVCGVSKDRFKTF